jgi:pimeloyl-ACP methyl ester carboxylesterase
MNFVLLHGCYQGGWIWQRVAAALRRNGHHALHPSLDGCGERRGAMRPGITLDSQAAEVADLLLYEDLERVVLAGTSTGGTVAARVVEPVPERIARLAFVEAVVLRPGENLCGVTAWRPPPAAGGPAFESPVPRETGHLVGLSAADVAWAAQRVTPHPLAPLATPVDLRQFWSRHWEVDVLRGRRSKTPPEAHQRRTADLLRGTWRELDADHFPMLTHPDEVAGFLLRGKRT